jgi:hypothetical protein
MRLYFPLTLLSDYVIVNQKLAKKYGGGIHNILEFRNLPPGGWVKG